MASYWALSALWGEFWAGALSWAADWACWLGEKR